MSATIRFEDGFAYDESIGRWSEIAGAEFLTWLAPPPGAHWLDVGCGTGVFSQMIHDRCAPAAVTGIDPSQAQLDYARTVHPGINYQHGDALALPFAPASFDQAVMALVIFFLPDPAKGVAEMARILRPGGTASTYAWDYLGVGSPTLPIQRTLEARGHNAPAVPNAIASSIPELRRLWSLAGLGNIETHSIDIVMRFENFAAYWAMMLRIPRTGPMLASLPPSESEAVRADLQQRVAPNANTPFTASARINVIQGSLPSTTPP